MSKIHHEVHQRVGRTFHGSTERTVWCSSSPSSVDDPLGHSGTRQGRMESLLASLWAASRLTGRQVSKVTFDSKWFAVRRVVKLRIPLSRRQSFVGGIWRRLIHSLWLLRVKFPFQMPSRHRVEEDYWQDPEAVSNTCSQTWRRYESLYECGTTVRRGADSCVHRESRFLVRVEPNPVRFAILLEMASWYPNSPGR